MGYNNNPDAARRRSLLFFFAVIFAVGGVATWFLTRPRPTVEQRITEAFQKARIAAQKGDIAGTVAVVSNDFRAGSLDKKRLRLLLFRTRQQAVDTDWQVEITPPRILPGPDNVPDKRLVLTRIVAREASSGNALWSTGDNSITLLMREEPTRLWGIFPSTTWRVLAAPSLPDF
ncbi:MAG: hypothetical protein H7145_19900 [Akkermansiaceae bacterium]|nr:hypothetical protein [Armatimonadota bacterium]